MDPCPFVRVVVESLALKLPSVTKPTSGSAIHPSTHPRFFCTLTLHQNTQTAPLSLSSSPVTPSSSQQLPSVTPDPAVSLPPPVIFAVDPKSHTQKPSSLLVTVYCGPGRTCGLVGSRAQLGRVRVGVDLETGAERAMVMQSGWVSLGGGGGGGATRRVAKLHLVVRTEPDPRFVFQFGGEPEVSPVVYQVQESIRQPVLSCRFSADRRRSTRPRSFPSESSRGGTVKGWLSAFGSQRDRPRKDQRKGWTVTIHDLSGSPVAAASMVTPFVPSPGSDRVSRSNPGAWLILRATGSSTGNWKPWARFEAWRERSPADALGYRFELVMDSGPSDCGLLVAQSSISAKRGGVFRIDPGLGGDVSKSGPSVGGFVMESTVEGEGKTSKPRVQVGVQHVSCMGDVALFVALSAAADLSMDACQLFSHKLRKELCCDQQQECSL